MNSIIKLAMLICALGFCLSLTMVVIQYNNNNSLGCSKADAYTMTYPDGTWEYVCP